MMRIVIAGGGYFSRLLACHICRTPHSVIVLSRTDRSAEFEPLGCQVVVVSYSDPSSLQYALRGANLVISTIPGAAQLALIDAARRTASIRRFVPSEFEGKLSARHRGGGDGGDALDVRGSAGALALLRRHGLAWTVFTCGLFYERFGPGGMGAYGMGEAGGGGGTGGTGGGGGGGVFLVDVAGGTADVVEKDREGKRIAVCLTSMDDTARFVAAAAEMAGVEGIRGWPEEFKVRGDALSVRALMDACQAVYGNTLIVTRRRYEDLQTHLAQSTAQGDVAAWFYTQRLLAMADGRYSFRPTLNGLVDASDLVDVRPVGFGDWLSGAWGGGGGGW